MTLNPKDVEAALDPDLVSFDIGGGKTMLPQHEFTLIHEAARLWLADQKRTPDYEAAVKIMDARLRHRLCGDHDIWLVDPRAEVKAIVDAVSDDEDLHPTSWRMIRKPARRCCPTHQAMREIVKSQSTLRTDNRLTVTLKLVGWKPTDLEEAADLIDRSISNHFIIRRIAQELHGQVKAKLES